MAGEDRDPFRELLVNVAPTLLEGVRGAVRLQAANDRTRWAAIEAIAAKIGETFGDEGPPWIEKLLLDLPSPSLTSDEAFQLLCETVATALFDGLCSAFGHIASVEVDDDQAARFIDRLIDSFSVGVMQGVAISQVDDIFNAAKAEVDEALRRKS